MTAKITYYGKQDLSGATNANSTEAEVIGTRAEIIASKPTSPAIGRPTDSAANLRFTPEGGWGEVIPLAPGGLSLRSSVPMAAPGFRATNPGVEARRWVTFGDSVANFAIAQALMQTGFRQRAVRLAAVGGSGSVLLLSTIQAWVADPTNLALKCDWASIEIGANDFAQSSATFIANVSAAVDALYAVGIRVCLIFNAPYDAHATETAQRNLDLETIAAAKQCPILRPWRSISSGAGAYLAGRSGDGLHPNKQYLYTVGTAARDQMRDYGILPRHEPVRSDMNGGPGNMYSNGMFLTDTNADGTADTVTKMGTGTCTLVSSAEIGKIQRLVYVAGTAEFKGLSIAGPTLVSGNTYLLRGIVRITTTAGSTFPKFNLYNSKASGDYNNDIVLNADSVTRQYEFNQEFVAVSSGAMTINLYSNVAADHAGTIEIEQFQVVDLTANPWAL